MHVISSSTAVGHGVFGMSKQSRASSRSSGRSVRWSTSTTTSSSSVVVPSSSPTAPNRKTTKRTSTVTSAKKKGFFDEMLDVIEGGPKLRKWYGTDSSVGARGEERPRRGSEDGGDGGDGEGQQQTETPVASTRAEVLKAWDLTPRKATLVTDVHTALGEAVVVQLIVAKQPVVAMGLDPETCAKRFGPYVTAADAGDLGDEGEMSYLLRKGIRAVICVGPEVGALPASVAKDAGVKHVIVVGSCGKSFGMLDPVFGGDDAKRRNAKRDEAFTKAFKSASNGVPLTIVRPGTVKPGLGGKAVAFSQSGSRGSETREADGATISLEDAAETVVRCLGAPPGNGQTLCFDAIETKGERRSWKTLFGELA